MDNALSQSERRFIHDLLRWDATRRSLDRLLCEISLVAAGVLLAGTAIFVARHLTDGVVFGVLVPGFALGLFFVGVYVVQSNRIRERHRLAEILRKVSGAGTIRQPSGT